MCKTKRLTAVIILSFFAGVPLGAQSVAGRVAGDVTDPTGAVIPGVEITAIDQETGKTVKSLTDSAGHYILYPLSPATYDLRAELPGFKMKTISGVKVDVSSTVAVDVRLEIGTPQEEVTVEARAGLLAKETPAFESIVERRQIEQLPLNGRNFTQLIFLGPGALDTSIDPDGGFGGISLNGNRAYSQEFLVDGTPNNNLFRGNTATPLSIDVIQEFKVSSAVAPAEKGQAGAVIEIVSRSGTNDLHGNLFFYHRGNTWQARNPFNTLGEQPFRRNQLGGSLGGPVILPGLYDGHNRTFFFFNYEGQRQKENVTRLSTLPLDEMWGGDFSSLLARRIQLKDPLAGGAKIPDNRLDLYKGGALISPVALKLRSFMGSPTFPDRIINNTLRFPEEFENRDQFTLRVDHQLTSSHALTGRLTIDNEDSFSANLMGSDPTVGLVEPNESRNASLNWTATLGATSVNELRTGWSNYSDIVHYKKGNQPTVETLGLKGFEPGTDLIPFLPWIAFSGRDSFTPIKYGRTPTFGEAALSMIDNVISLSEAFTHHRSNHTIKTGIQVYRTYLNVLQQSTARGLTRFSGSSSSRSTGYSFADFLMGLPSSTREIPIKPKILLKRTEFATFLQDDWRVTPSFTLHLGLRHELFLNPIEERNRLSMFDLATGNTVVATDENGNLPTSEYLPSVVARLTDGNGNWLIPIVSDREAGYARGRLIRTQWNNFAPRFGFAYRLNPEGSWVVRGGYGIFYTRFPVQYLLQTIAVNPPFAGLFNYSQRISKGQPAITFEEPYNPSRFSASVTPEGLAKDFRLADNQEWHLTVERALGWETTVSLAYIGNKGTHLFRSINANARFLDPATGEITTKYADTYGTSRIRVRLADANSIYNAMALEFRRRYTRGFSFQGNWTWAKGIDDASNAATLALDVLDLGRDRADSSFSRRHIIKFNGIYDLPFGRGRTLLGGLGGWRQVALGDWQVSGIWRFTTGRFMTASMSGSLSALSGNRPDLIPGRNPNLPKGQRGPDRWFNVNAFAVPPDVDPQTGDARFGNAGRNILIGPGENFLDLGLFKSFPIAEHYKTTVRLEVFNALNHPHWGNPVLTINDSSAGTINSTRKPMRQVQFAVRFDF